MEFLATWQFWIVAAIVLVMGEIASPGFVLGCVALACVPPACLGFFWPIVSSSWLDERVSLVVFALSALLGLFFIRPSVVRHLYSAEERRSDVDGMVGIRGIVVKAIPEGETGGGYVRVRGTEWWAFHVDGDAVAPGMEVEIVEVRGARVMVRLVGEDSRTGSV